MELSIRLKTVAEAVTKGNRVADVGTDHGYVPIYLVKNNLSVGLLQKEIYNLSELDFKGIWTELVAYCKQKGFSRK